MLIILSLTRSLVPYYLFEQWLRGEQKDLQSNFGMQPKPQIINVFSQMIFCLDIIQWSEAKEGDQSREMQAMVSDFKLSLNWV